jgi:hypothetical protein
MNRSNVIRVVASIKLLPMYVCACGVQAPGDTIRTEVDSHDADALSQAIDNVRLDPNHMPVGWASFYSPNGTDIRCPACH